MWVCVSMNTGESQNGNNQNLLAASARDRASALRIPPAPLIFRLSAMTGPNDTTCEGAPSSDKNARLLRLFDEIRERLRDTDREPESEPKS